MFRRDADLIVYYATVVQIVTAFFILFASTPLRVARLGAFYEFFPTPALGGVLMFLAGVVAIIGLLRSDKDNCRFLFFFPQHFFLLLSTGSAVLYIIQGHYADGVIRSWQFILIDQLPLIVITVLYAFSIFDFRKKEIIDYGTKT